MHNTRFAFLVIAAASGCGIDVTTTGVNSPLHVMPARSIQTVDVFTSSPPSRPHVDVALITAVDPAPRNPNSSARLLEQIRKRAGEMGCDAVSLTAVTGRDVVEGMVATCIAYTDRVTQR